MEDGFIATDSIVRSIGALWQKRLRLQDWDIEFTVRRERDMSQTGLMGECFQAEEHRRAEIVVLDPIDHDPETWLPYDLDQTIVHELLHLHFGWLGSNDDSRETVCLEQAINALSAAFVRVARRDPYTEAEGSQ